MQSATHSTCCSIEVAMLLGTDGLPGPVIMNRLGKPLVCTPRYVTGPADHFSASDTPSRPRISISSSAPVMAS